MAKEYRTTGTPLHETEYFEGGVGSYNRTKEPKELQPTPPDSSDGWNLVGATATERYLLWFWQKEVLAL